MVSVERVLPWRRTEGGRAPEVEPLIAPFRGRQAKGQVALVAKAYELAASKHTGQVRRSGEAYLSHPLAVARIVAEQTQDPVAIAAALLHDVVEDTDLTLSDLRRHFPSPVAEIVDGVTKVERTLFATKEEQQAATMRKLVIAMADDLRVLIIKLADRLHNMRTLAALPLHRQHAIARETFDVYAPLAMRLGMDEMRTQLEDLAFAALHPKWYAEIDQMVWNRTPEREVYLTQVAEEVRMRLEEVGIDAEVTGRPKHLWSIYEKMVIKGREFSDIFDLVGIRVVVGTIKDCYAAVGSIHQMWMPVQGRFKDYIAMPKYNTYQSLHTTAVGPGGKQLEVQIRTREMDMRATFGVAAHWRYKAEPEELEWLDRMIEWQSDVSDPSEFMANLKVDLDQDEVVVFTPKGEVVHLPTGAGPVDFAYAIHTQIGHKCIGAKVDGNLVELSTPLRSGQTVEIFTAKTEDAGPSPDWLEWVASPKAASKIRQWLAQQRRDSVLEVGQEDLEKELRVRGLPVAEVMDSGAVLRAAVELNYADLDALYRAVGERHVSAKAVAARVRRVLAEGGPETDAQLSTSVLEPRRPPRPRDAVAVHVEGMDDVLIRLARCCTPVPPDPIMGFHTRGRGVSVHRADCANAVSLATAQKGRLVEVEWDSEGQGSYLVSVEVRALDRTRLLRDVASVLADHHVNIVACQTLTGADRVSKMRFDFEVSDPSHLGAALATIQSIEGVYSSRRIMPSGGPDGARVTP
jgi:GTP pyrophosphokinase